MSEFWPCGICPISFDFCRCPFGIRMIFGKEMRGGLEGGHSHVSFSSTPILKKNGDRGDCPACFEWDKELTEGD